MRIEWKALGFSRYLSLIFAPIGRQSISVDPMRDHGRDRAVRNHGSIENRGRSGGPLP